MPPTATARCPKEQAVVKHATRVVLEEARVVRQMFDWVGRERVSRGEVARRLMQAGVLSHTGKPRLRSE